MEEEGVKVEETTEEPAAKRAKTEGIFVVDEENCLHEELVEAVKRGAAAAGKIPEYLDITKFPSSSEGASAFFKRIDADFLAEQEVLETRRFEVDRRYGDLRRKCAAERAKIALADEECVDWAPDKFFAMRHERANEVGFRMRGLKKRVWWQRLVDPATGAARMIPRRRFNEIMTDLTYEIGMDEEFDIQDERRSIRVATNELRLRREQALEIKYKLTTCIEDAEQEMMEMRWEATRHIEPTQEEKEKNWAFMRLRTERIREIQRQRLRAGNRREKKNQLQAAREEKEKEIKLRKEEARTKRRDREAAEAAARDASRLLARIAYRDAVLHLYRIEKAKDDDGWYPHGFRVFWDVWSKRAFTFSEIARVEQRVPTEQLDDLKKFFLDEWRLLPPSSKKAYSDRAAQWYALQDDIRDKVDLEIQAARMRSADDEDDLCFLPLEMFHEDNVALHQQSDHYYTAPVPSIQVHHDIQYKQRHKSIPRCHYLEAFEDITGEKLPDVDNTLWNPYWGPPPSSQDLGDGAPTENASLCEAVLHTTTPGDDAASPAGVADTTRDDVAGCGLADLDTQVFLDAGDDSGGGGVTVPDITATTTTQDAGGASNGGLAADTDDVEI